MKITKLLLIYFMFLVCSCAPIYIHTYFHPTSTGGTLTKSLCMEGFGPFDRLYFNREETRIGFNIEKYGKPYRLTVTFWVPEGSKAIIDDPNLILSTADHKYDIHLSNRWKSTQKGKEFEMTGYTSDSNSNYWEQETKSRIYTFEALFDAPKLEQFNLSGLKVSINGTSYILPEISFYVDKYTEYFLPLNC